MRLPFFRSKKTISNEPGAKDTLVVIGVHREEAAFGEEVAKQLDGKNFDILRVGHGLSARRPRPDQLQAYLDGHDRLYRRIAEDISDGCQLMIDLHCRQKDRADADLFAADAAFLDHCLKAHEEDPLMTGKYLRPIRMVSDADLDELSMEALRSQLFSKPELPEAIWRAEQPVYVGIEIYLQTEGTGSPDEWLFACHLIDMVRRVFLETRPD